MWNWLRSLLAAGLDPRARNETWAFDPTLERTAPPRPLEVFVHPLRSSRVVVLLPGYEGTIDGYAEKYRKLAEHLVARGVGAVVRSGNGIVSSVAR